jgi:FkbM family methyltransferase
VVSRFERLDERLGTDLVRSVRLGVQLPGDVVAHRLPIVVTAVLLGSRRWRRPITVRLNGPDGPVPFTIPDYAAFRVLGEVFVSAEYAVELAEPPRTVLDLGANIGASALFFRRRYPAARIVAVEASPTLAKILRDNTRQLRVDVRHCAVAASDGAVNFYESRESWSGSTTRGDGAPTTVPAVRLDDLLHHPVDLLKIDVEGAEFDVLPASRRLHRVNTIIGEIHAPPGSRPVAELLRHLPDFRVTTNDPGPLVPFTVFVARRRSAPRDRD